MGQSVSVDAKAIELKEFLRLGQAAVTAAPQTQSPPPRSGAGGAPAPSAGHHIKAWKFDSRGRIIVDSPVEFCDENGLFKAELQRNCSYLILHVRPAEEAAGGVAAEALEELAASAGASCTPRGLAIEVASHCELGAGPSHGSGAEGAAVGGILSAAIRYAVFVWHGLGVDPLVKAHTMGKAFELDRLLRHGLLQQPGFLDGLRHAVALKGISQHTGSAEDREDREQPAASEPGRQGRNRLLSNLLESSQRGAQCLLSGGGTPRSSGGHRFPRLGLSVCRSLGVSLPSTGGWIKEQRWAQPAASPPAAPPSCTSPPAKQAPPPAGTTRVGKGIFIPRLALSALSSAPSPRDALGPAAGPMEVDQSQEPCDSSGRKRPRGPDAAQPPPTARGAPAAPGAGAHAGAGAVPHTARLDLRSCQQLPPTVESPPRVGARPKGAMPALNLAGLGGQRQPASNRTDAPAMLNLEEIHMSEEDLINSYDPNNEENNYHLPHHLYKQLQLKHFRQVCSEVIPGKLFISSFQVAGDLDSLRRQQITHIVNTAADVCDNRFPEHFHYMTYYLKDTNNEDISLLFYRTLEWIQSAIDSGGRVLVHCREGVSRSATMIIAYLMWRFNLSFDAAHERIRKVRPICNPNTGFTCQLLLLGKKLGVSGCNSQGATPTERPVQPERTVLFRVAPYHPKEPFLLFVPVDWPATWPLFDPRFGWVVQQGSALTLWLGSQVPDVQAVQGTVKRHMRWLETFERLHCVLTVAEEGREPPQFWQALPGGTGALPADRGGLAAIRPAFDADFEILRSLATAAVGTAPAEEELARP